MLTLQYTLDGNAKQKLDPIADDRLTTQMLDETVSILLNRTRQRYLAEVDPEGKPWPPSQAGIKRRSKGGTGTLFDTGRLFRSIQLVASSPTERVIGTDVPYAAKHQYGLDGLPVRAFLGVNQEDLFLVDQRLQQLVNRATS